MTKVDKEMRISQLQSEIVNRLKAIESQKADKKSVNKRFNSVIKTLEVEKIQLLEELEDLQREELTEAADELLEENDSLELTTQELD
jgi:hypothetical protein